jgi:hypothetical protein
MLRPAQAIVRWSCLSAVLLAGGRAQAAELPFADAFAARGFAVGPSGTGTGSTRGATREYGEPKHGGKRGSASIWLSWVAPANGVATFTTAGTTFDTLLSVYAYERELKGGLPGPADPLKPFADLKQVAEQDDDYPTPDATSQVTFGVRAGVRYEVAVDGFAGATGPVTLGWTFSELSQQVPLILSSEADRSVRAGDTLVLSVDIQGSEAVELEWYFNGEDIDGADNYQLVIPNFSQAHVGEYQLEVKFKEGELYSAPIEIQINSEGDATALARDKPLDALDAALAEEAAPSSRVARAALARNAGLGVTRGFSGSQIFNTVFARRDPDEPPHCGLVGSASYWFAYQPPADGTARLDTDGSNFDTVLAVYTFDPPLIGYAGLIPVTCDHNSGPNGLTSRLEFAASKTRTYLVVVDGANQTRGVAHLNYRLLTDTQPPPVAARFLSEQPVLTFPSVLGARYRLESTPALGGTNWTSLTVLEGTGAPLSFTNLPPASTAAFFRVRVE